MLTSFYVGSPSEELIFDDSRRGLFFHKHLNKTPGEKLIMVRLPNKDYIYHTFCEVGVCMEEVFKIQKLENFLHGKLDSNSAKSLLNEIKRVCVL